MKRIKRSVVFVVSIIMAIVLAVTPLSAQYSFAVSSGQTGQVAKKAQSDESVSGNNGAGQISDPGDQQKADENDQSSGEESGKEADPSENDGKDDSSQADPGKTDDQASTEDGSKVDSDNTGDVSQDGEAATDNQKLTKKGISKDPKKGDPESELTGNIGSTGWIWKVTGEGDDLSLEFEYTGSGNAPDLNIPANFLSGIDDSLGDSKSKIKTIKFPEQTASIGASAFKDFDSVKTLSGLENTKVSSIGNEAFYDCDNLEEVHFPATLSNSSSNPTIGDSAFFSNDKLKVADFSKIGITGDSFTQNHQFRLGQKAFADCDLRSVSLPDNTNQVGNYAFQNNKNLKTADLPALSYMANSDAARGSYLFDGCKSLEDLTFREVSNRSHYSNNQYANTFGTNMLKGCDSLKKLDLSGYKGQNRAALEINNIFPDNDCTALEELILPKNPLQKVALRQASFHGKHGLSDLSVIKNPESISSLDDNTFNGTGITKADLSDWTSLTEIKHHTFSNCDNLTKVVIPENVTTIGSRAFSNDPQLKEVTVHSEKLTSADPSIFDGSGKLETVTIGKEVKTLSGDFLSAIPANTADVLFEGENIITITKASSNKGQHPLKDLSGRYYVDHLGVLYQLNDNGEGETTATVSYIPPDLAHYDIPSSIALSDGGGTYTVNRVKGYFCNLARQLNSLTFMQPDQVKIPASAFTGWTTSQNANGKTINGALVIDPDDFAGVSALCDYPIKTGENFNEPELVKTILDEIPNADGDTMLKTAIVVNQKNPGEDDIYHYKTGEKANYTIAISNSDNTIMNKIVRVYFAYDNSGYDMGAFPVGDFQVVIPNGEKYPVSVKETDTPGIYYYEVTGIKPGDTLAFKNDVFYESPNSPGGGLRIWTETLTAEEAAAHDHTVDNPKKYMQLEWSTEPVKYNIEKKSAGVYNPSSGKVESASLKSGDHGVIYVNNLAFRINEKNEGSAPTTEGQDHIRWVQYQDTLQPPDGIDWDPAIIAAIKKGPKAKGESTDGWYIAPAEGATDYDGTTYTDAPGGGTVYCKTLWVTAGGVNRQVAYLYCPTEDAKLIHDLNPNIVTKDGQEQIMLDWYMNNTSLDGSSSEQEYMTHGFYVRFGDNALIADPDKIDKLLHPDDPAQSLKIHNTAHEKRHYSYSPDQESEDDADAPLTGDANLESSKHYEKNDNSNGTYYEGGTEDYTYVELKNTGITKLDKWGSATNQTDEQGNKIYDGKLITDNLPVYFYIQDKDLQQMLNMQAKTTGGATEKTYPVGDWLTITIKSASLFTPGLYQPTQGVDQSQKYSTGTISATNDTNARKYHAAQIVFKKKSEGVIEATLSGDSITANNRSYEIGVGKDYATITEFFNAIGYMPTSSTQYCLEWKAPNETPNNFVLDPGDTIRFRVLGTYKTTPMMITGDTSNCTSSRYYSSYQSSLRNYANVYAQVGDEQYSKQITTKYVHSWDYEMYISKGFSGGATDGSVINYNLYCYNQSGKPYDKMSMHDLMYGPQVLLAPVSENPDLKGPNGETLEKYTYSGVEYWILNKPGEYRNVKKIGTSSSSGGSAYTADLIKVTKNSSGLNTEIHWSPFNNWGSSSSAFYIYYKALCSLEKAGVPATTGDSSSYTFNNKAWLGDHQGHRLYATAGNTYQVYSFNKKILNEDGTTTSYSRLRKGDKVTYQFTITNRSSEADIQLKGNRIYDRLPNTYGVFEWTRGKEGLPANVTNLRYIATDGTYITVGSGENEKRLNIDGSSNANIDDSYWRVERENSNSNYYNIKWNSDFVIHFPKTGTVKILVDVTYPDRPESGASPWDNYIAASNGQRLYNYFYLFGSSSSVSHSLESEGKPVLYKGVYDTGLTTKKRNSSGTVVKDYESFKSRLVYTNGQDNPSSSSDDLRASTVTYYTVLYNGSYDRLYLSDIQDVLPRGFKFNTFCNRYTTTESLDYSSTSSCHIGWNGRLITSMTNSENGNYGMVTVSNATDQFDNNSISYRRANLVASTTNVTVDGETRQRVTFKFNGTSYPHYDSDVGKPYLEPGEAIRFCYNCEVGSEAKTDDIATNTTAMPYYDYYGTGFDLHVPRKDGKPDRTGTGGATQTPRKINGVVDNDGFCEQLTGSDVQKLGMTTSGFNTGPYTTQEANGGNWLMSNVSLERSVIVPGTSKTVQGSSYRKDGATPETIEGPTATYSAETMYGTPYKGGLTTQDIVNWRVRVLNESGTGNKDVSATIEDYTVRDMMATPYSFTGQVFYNMYRASSAAGERRTVKSQPIFTLGSRKEGDTSVKIASGDATPSTNLLIGTVENDDDDDWFTFGAGTAAGRVKIERVTADGSDKGKEVMTIRLQGSKYSIPSGYWCDFAIHTMFVQENAIIVSEGKYNDVLVYPEQHYDPERVAQGSARTMQVEDENGIITNVNDGIESGASVMLSMGYNTESWKKITEIGKESNNALSNESKNYINLSEKRKAFRYDLYVKGPTDIMNKIVLIDDLPQQGDHSAFVKDDKRNSAFKVSFLEDDPDFKLYLKPTKDGTEKLLDRSKYKLYVNQKTEFNANDWKGEGDGWVDLSDMSDDEIGEYITETNPRSVRIVIEDPNAFEQSNEADHYMMSNEPLIHLSFNAKIDDKGAVPGNCAWNSFGYRYEVPLTFNGTSENSTSLALEAMPLNVGIKYPAAPQITKTLSEEVTKEVEVIDPETNQPVIDPETGKPKMEEVKSIEDHAAAQDMVFGFIVYEGEPIEALNDAQSMTDSEIAAILEESGRKYIYAPVEVKKGEKKGELGLWTFDYPYIYDPDTGKFVENTDDIWEWTDEGKYSVVEMPLNDYNYEFKGIQVGIQHHDSNNVQIVNSNQTKVQVTAGNEYKPEYKSISVEKVWDDDKDRDRIRPDSVNVKLYRTGKPGSEKELVDEQEIGEEQDWQYKWDKLLVEEEDGTHYTYSVEEDSVKGYDTTVTHKKDNEGEEDENSFVVTNKHEPETMDLEGKKTWNDDGNRDGVRPESITVYLHANGEKVDEQEVQAGDDGNWSYTFKDVLKNTNGVPIEYTVSEEAIEDYSTTYDGLNVTNTHTPEKTSVTVTKAWEDNNDQDGIRPEEIKVHLLANGEDTGKELLLGGDHGLTGSFTELDVYEPERQKIEYTVKEEAVSGYTTEITGDQTEGYVITNTHEVEKTEISGKKIWDDANDQDKVRPEEIKIHLYANGEEVADKEVTEKDNWEYSFKDMPKYYDKGKEIDYIVTEDSVDNYNTIYSAEGFDVTNKYTPKKTSINVRKVWDDNNDKDHIRPKSVKVHLFADGEDTGKEMTLSKTNKFRGVFTDLDVYKDGRRILYTVKEDSVKGYVAEVTGNEQKGYTITNKIIPTKSLLRKIRKTDTSDNVPMGLLAALMLISGAGMLILGRRQRREGSKQK